MFGDEVVRQAITLALDKDAISESIYGGLYEKQIHSSRRPYPIVM